MEENILINPTGDLAALLLHQQAFAIQRRTPSPYASIGL